MDVEVDRREQRDVRVAQPREEQRVRLAVLQAWRDAPPPRSPLSTLCWLDTHAGDAAKLKLSDGVEAPRAARAAGATEGAAGLWREKRGQGAR